LLDIAGSEARWRKITSSYTRPRNSVDPSFWRFWKWKCFRPQRTLDLEAWRSGHTPARQRLDFCGHGGDSSAATRRRRPMAGGRIGRPRPKNEKRLENKAGTCHITAVGPIQTPVRSTAFVSSATSRHPIRGGEATDSNAPNGAVALSHEVEMKSRQRPPAISIPKVSLAHPRPRFNRAPIRPSALAGTDAGVLDLSLVGEIGFDVDADALAQQVSDFNGSAINLNINSGGGEIFSALNLYNALAQSPANVTAIVGGWCASAASFVAMAADTIKIGAAATMMVHEISGLVIGIADDFRAEALVLDQLTASLCDIYAARTGLPLSKIVQMVRAETWLNAEQACANGFADVVIGLKGKPDVPIPAASDTAYRNMPADLRTALKAAQTNPTPARSGHIETRADLEKQLRDKLGIAHGAARKIAAGGFAALAGNDNSDIETLAARIAQAAAQLRN
jgi:ATP-dependent protease ClpP protease subunit